MRKTILGFILLLCLSSTAFTAEDGRTNQGILGREGIVLGRGLLNVIGTPLELIRTPIAEWDTYHWIWPVTFIPRAITNVIARASSAVNDLIVYPWVVPFTDDLSPITEPMGLPEYAWSRV